jgi:hypothetical protein
MLGMKLGRWGVQTKHCIRLEVSKAEQLGWYGSCNMSIRAMSKSHEVFPETLCWNGRSERRCLINKYKKPQNKLLGHNPRLDIVRMG